MKIVTCKNGHRFHIDQYHVCPICGQAAEAYSVANVKINNQNDKPPNHIKDQVNAQSASEQGNNNNKKRKQMLVLFSSLIVGGLAVCIIMGIILFNRMTGNDNVFNTGNNTTEIPTLAEQSSTSASFYSVYNDEEMETMRTNIKDGDSFEINHVLLTYGSDMFSLSYNRYDANAYNLSLIAEKFDLSLYNNRIVSLSGVYDGQYKVDSIQSERIIIDDKESLMDFADIKIHKFEESASVIKCEVFYDAIALHEYCIKYDDMSFGFMIISDGTVDLSAYVGKKVDCTITLKENTANYGGEYATEDYWEINSIDNVY